MGGKEGYVPLFESKTGKDRIVVYRVFSISIFVGIVSIWIYRSTNINILLPPISPINMRRLGWIGLFGAEVWFGLYWVLTQSLRWNPVFRYPFPNNLSQRHEEELPKVDIFVCTADPTIEPPVMVINTVLSLMAYDYPPDKLTVYLSDDAGSDLTFYALMEASHFSTHWIPFCNKFKVEPTSPAAYFASNPDPVAVPHHDFALIKNLYKEMENQIETATKLGRIPEEVRSEHEAFSQWDSFSSKRDHPAILQILIDGRDSAAVDVEGCALPTLVYLAREKRPQYHHNFKAGAMNALIRISSQISNGPIILNVDCDMYSNNSKSVREALCFLMDEEKGHEIAFVQFPQNFMNITKNDLYYSTLRVISEVEFYGLDGNGGPLYIGSGCFHRRDVLCGRKFTKENRIKWSREDDDDDDRKSSEESANELQDRVKDLASCTCELNTQWGKEMGLKYGCPVEDVITGIYIQSQGWKSIYYNPKREGFLGVAPTSLDQTLVQHKRWSEGDLQILLTRYSPLWYGVTGKINPGLLMGYLTYCLWSPNCLATLYYSIVPSIYLLKGIPLFPQVSSPWFLPFGYVIFAKYTYSLAEFLRSGGTILGWWNCQRIWLYQRTSSYFFAFVDTILRQLGFADTAFVVTAKVADEDVSRRYEQEMMEFGTPSSMFTMLASLAMFNLMCMVVVVKRVLLGQVGLEVCDVLGIQILLCVVLVLINLPLYQALFLRKDKGKMPSSVTIKSLVVALFACITFTFLF